MMTVDQERYVVIARANGRTLETEAVIGTHMLPTAMAKLGFRHPFVEIACVKVEAYELPFWGTGDSLAQTITDALLARVGGGA